MENEATRKDGNGMDTYEAASNDRELTDSMGEGIDALLANLRERREAEETARKDRKRALLSPTSADIRATFERGDWT